MKRSVKGSIKTDKRNNMKMLANKAEEAAHQGNILDLYTSIKKLTGKFNRPETPVKAKDGKVIRDEEGQRKRWVEHFEELLNRPEPQNPPDIQPADSSLLINCSTPTKKVCQAIKQLRNSKTAGPDGISDGTED